MKRKIDKTHVRARTQDGVVVTKPKSRRHSSKKRKTKNIEQQIWDYVRSKGFFTKSIAEDGGLLSVLKDKDWLTLEKQCLYYDWPEPITKYTPESYPLSRPACNTNALGEPEYCKAWMGHYIGAWCKEFLYERKTCQALLKSTVERCVFYLPYKGDSFKWYLDNEISCHKDFPEVVYAASEFCFRIMYENARLHGTILPDMDYCLLEDKQYFPNKDISFEDFVERIHTKEFLNSGSTPSAVLQKLQKMNKLQQETDDVPPIKDVDNPINWGKTFQLILFLLLLLTYVYFRVRSI